MTMHDHDSAFHIVISQNLIIAVFPESTNLKIEKPLNLSTVWVEIFEGGLFLCFHGLLQSTKRNNDGHKHYRQSTLQVYYVC